MVSVSLSCLVLRLWHLDMLDCSGAFTLLFVQQLGKRWLSRFYLSSQVVPVTLLDVGGIILGPHGSFSLCSVCFSLAPGSWYLDFFRILLERFGMIGCWVVVNLF